MLQSVRLDATNMVWQESAYQNTSFQSHFDTIFMAFHALKVRVWNKIKKYFRDLVILTFLTLSYLTCLTFFHLQLKNIRSDPFFKCFQNRNCVVFGKNPNYPIQLILIRYNLVGDELVFWMATYCWRFKQQNLLVVIYIQLIAIAPVGL